MVCLGNICRSPLAEGLLNKKIVEAGLEDEISVASCGTSGYHIGDSPDDRSQANALENGLDISHLRSSQFMVSDFDTYDKIYCMDQSNYNDLKKISPSESHMTKVDLLLNASQPGANRKVPDPYYGGPNGFQTVYDLVEMACESILIALKNSK